MNINNFNDLVNEAKKQNIPQRMLFLFAKAESLKGVFAVKHKSGTITPVMCADKLPEEIKTFQDLVTEADGISRNWNFVFIATFGDNPLQAPSSKDADSYLKRMCDDLAEGKDLSKYVVLDRDESPVVIG